MITASNFKAGDLGQPVQEVSFLADHVVGYQGRAVVLCGAGGLLMVSAEILRGKVSIGSSSSTTLGLLINNLSQIL